jgi:hypothetical protein
MLEEVVELQLQERMQHYKAGSGGAGSPTNFRITSRLMQVVEEVELMDQEQLELVDQVVEEMVLTHYTVAWNSRNS